MPEDPFDNAIINKGSLRNILVTPTVRQMAKELQVNRKYKLNPFF
jgi:DNA-binding transcriptional regulator YhcF (GntR family)